MVEKLKGLFLKKILRCWGTKALGGFVLEGDRTARR